MNLLKYYQQYRDKWWALPLVLPALLLPVARWANTYTMLNGHMVFLYYLPLALVLSLMMFFGWAAIPGIIIGLLLTLAHGMMFEQSIGVLFHFLIPCVLCWGGCVILCYGSFVILFIYAALFLRFAYKLIQK